MCRWYSTGPAVYDTTMLTKNTHMILTIRLPRYFSTSDKLRTDTLALGILIPCLRSVRSWKFFSSGPGLVWTHAWSRFHVEPRFFPSLSLIHTRIHSGCSLQHKKHYVCEPKPRLFLSAGWLSEEGLTLSTRVPSSGILFSAWNLIFGSKNWS